MKTITFKAEYKDGDGICVEVINKAPREARTKADLIAVYVVKKKKGKLLKSEANYYTPDEAQGLAIGLLRAVDVLMEKHYQLFRKTKDKK